ncbi:MAG: transposase [Muribaculaceae bacterium]|nr:transposase [Muribaculaceae bacterium]
MLEYSHITGTNRVNKSNLSKRRNLIPPQYIRDLHRSIVLDIYKNLEPERWNGYLLFAGDGTTYSLPGTAGVKKVFLDGRKTGNGQQALARGVVLKDVLNDIVVDSNIECYGRDEISLLIDELEEMPKEIVSSKLVVVLDRKYCAYTLITKMISLGIKFIIRVKEHFNAEVDDFIKSGEIQKDITLRPAPTTTKKLTKLYGKGNYSSYNVRLVRMSNSVVVMTSVSDVSLIELGENDVYHARWDDETTIGFIKNNLQVEIFSGISVCAILQDFYAKTIVYNLLSLLVRQAAELRHDTKPRQINRNVALGIFRINIVDIIPVDTVEINQNLSLVLKEIASVTMPIQPPRHNPRAFRKIKHSGKYITMTNYARAI